MSKKRRPSAKQTKDIPSLHRPLNWRVDEFCKAYCMGKTKFYSLVKSGQIRLMKCGRTTLISEAERKRFQAAVKAGEV